MSFLENDIFHYWPKFWFKEDSGEFSRGPTSVWDDYFAWSKHLIVAGSHTPLGEQRHVLCKVQELFIARQPILRYNLGTKLLVLHSLCYWNHAVPTCKTLCTSPATHSLTLSSSLEVWWTKVKKLDHRCLKWWSFGSFFPWIGFQVQSWTCTHWTWRFYFKLKIELALKN